MSLFAIADTHLSFGTDKPMDSFEGWQDYTTRLEKNWNAVVTDRDTVVIAGDISWAMSFEELKPDFAFLHRLPGTKLIVKGNHDYWWNTMTKMNAFLEANGFTSIKIVHNNSIAVGNVSVCGSRGWFFDSDEAQDEKVLNREVNRIKTSLDAAQGSERLVFLHYPPITANGQCDEILALLSEYEIKECYYGHLHGSVAHYAIDEEVDGIEFKLISADRLRFTPLLVRKF